jgi:hypothetical protein
MNRGSSDMKNNFTGFLHVKKKYSTNHSIMNNDKHISRKRQWDEKDHKTIHRINQFPW